MAAQRPAAPRQDGAARKARTLHVGLATCETEILEAQKLRYQAGELKLDTPAAASLASALNAPGWQARQEGESLVLRPATP